jgi:hypothetical protein
MQDNYETTNWMAKEIVSRFYQITRLKQKINISDMQHPVRSRT